MAPHDGPSQPFVPDQQHLGNQMGPHFNPYSASYGIDASSQIQNYQHHLGGVIHQQPQPQISQSASYSGALPHHEHASFHSQQQQQQQSHHQNHSPHQSNLPLQRPTHSNITGAQGMHLQSMMRDARHLGRPASMSNLRLSPQKSTEPPPPAPNYGFHHQSSPPPSPSQRRHPHQQSNMNLQIPLQKNPAASPVTTPNYGYQQTPQDQNHLQRQIQHSPVLLKQSHQQSPPVTQLSTNLLPYNTVPQLHHPRPSHPAHPSLLHQHAHSSHQNQHTTSLENPSPLVQRITPSLDHESAQQLNSGRPHHIQQAPKPLAQPPPNQNRELSPQDISGKSTSPLAADSGANRVGRTKVNSPNAGINFQTDVDNLMKILQSKESSSSSDTPVKPENQVPEVMHTSPEPVTYPPSNQAVYNHPFANDMQQLPRSRSDSERGARRPARPKKRHDCSYPGCDKTFNQKTHLDIHVRAHTGDKPFQCDKCDQRFTQAGNLKTHQRRHTGEKPYSCEICGKSFAQRGNVRAHQAVHDGTKPFTCRLDQCNKKFTQLGNLKSHQNKFHAATIQALKRKWQPVRDPAELDPVDRELFYYFTEMYKNSNRGIKGRGKDRKITQIGPATKVQAKGPGGTMTLRRATSESQLSVTSPMTSSSSASTTEPNYSFAADPMEEDDEPSMAPSYSQMQPPSLQQQQPQHQQHHSRMDVSRQQLPPMRPLVGGASGMGSIGMGMMMSMGYASENTMDVHHTQIDRSFDRKFHF